MTRCKTIPALALTISVALVGAVDAHPELGVVPSSVAEAKLTLTKEALSSPTHPRHPPGNLRAEDYRRLLEEEGPLILVQFNTLYRNPDRVAAISVYLANADVHLCYPRFGTEEELRASSHTYKRGRLFPVGTIEHDGRLYHGIIRHTRADIRGLVIYLYDGQTGAFVTYSNKQTTRGQRYRDQAFGHFQRHIPRVVYEMCPGFPAAAELGSKINEAQTAWTYPELVAQHPGDRILRPDLIKSPAHEFLTPTIQSSNTRGADGAASGVSRAGDK
ncbi:MAG: hypothetical protein OXC63_08395 [Aestuariivita sp.]|nr:hypothetical protein [Aestuariivita sp.]MCY4345411.1 hypothetical protein [Aestuariivita sp.]